MPITTKIRQTAESTNLKTIRLLIGINPIISPELIKVLMEMGHGDEIVFTDRNFPANSIARHIIRYDGCNSITQLLDAVLPLFPLDYAADFSLVLTHPAVKQGNDPPIWTKFIELVKKYPYGDKKALLLERPAFMDRAAKAFCIVLTSEPGKCGNLILRKGIIPE